MEKNLKEYIKRDRIYQEWKKGNLELSDFEMFCVEHCKDIEEMLEENKRLKKKIEKMRKILQDE